MLVWLWSQIKRIVTFIAGCFIVGAASLLASPDFSPQFRWQQGGMTVANNHEKMATENNKNATKNNAGNGENDQEVSQDKQQEGATGDGGVDETIKTIETSIKIDDIIEPPASYRYSSFNKRDPFAYPDRDELMDDEFVVSKLQRHDVASLKLVGVWRLSTGISKALIITPTGEGVVAVIGDPVGQNNGEVMEIGKDKIIVREYLMTPDGTHQFNDIDMFLEEFFGSGAAFIGEGLQSISAQDGEVSLEGEFNKLLQSADKLIKGANAPTTNAPAMPAATEAINAPASTNAPAQP